jgi:hypothetical protein
MSAANPRPPVTETLKLYSKDIKRIVRHLKADLEESSIEPSDSDREAIEFFDEQLKKRSPRDVAMHSHGIFLKFHKHIADWNLEQLFAKVDDTEWDSHNVIHTMGLKIINLLRLLHSSMDADAIRNRYHQDFKNLTGRSADFAISLKSNTI